MVPLPNNKIYPNLPQHQLGKPQCFLNISKWIYISINLVHLFWHYLAEFSTGFSFPSWKTEPKAASASKNRLRCLSSRCSFSKQRKPNQSIKKQSNSIGNLKKKRKKDKMELYRETISVFLPLGNTFLFIPLTLYKFLRVPPANEINR